jgi:hypothetical protein
MKEEQYLEKLVNDFGVIQGFTSEESSEFLWILNKLLTHNIANDKEFSNEEIINLIINKND